MAESTEFRTNWVYQCKSVSPPYGSIASLLCNHIASLLHHYDIIITSLLHHYYIIITSLLSSYSASGFLAPLLSHRAKIGLKSLRLAKVGLNTLLLLG